MAGHSHTHVMPEPRAPRRADGERRTSGRTDVGGVLQRAREVGVPEDWVPLCEDNGDYYCITPTGEIVYWSHNGATDEQWANLAAWISAVWIGGR